MSARSEATLAAVVAALADAGHDAGTPAFRARDVAPIRATSWLRVAARTVELHMRAAGYAVSSATAGAMVLTPAGLAAVEAARRARGGVLGAGRASGTGAGGPRGGTALSGRESGGFPQRLAGGAIASPCVGECALDDSPAPGADMSDALWALKLVGANARAWAALCERCDPPGPHRAEDAPEGGKETEG